ncbi:MAG: dTMP kinase [Gammaproteobacteria bacterium]|nr:dTMP kinase [Gammaproteobacteria bacterium]
MLNKPYFITLEGVEGAGKSSAIKFIGEYLHLRDIRYITTREPGGTKIAEEIRGILLAHHKEKMASSTEVLLAFAGRAQHLDVVIKPALAKGQWVICDRFTDASYAYQGAGRKMLAERIETLENWVQGDLRPDLTIIMDLDPQVGLERAKKCSDPDRFEVEDAEFFQRVRQCYLDRAQQFPKRYAVVNAEQSIVEVEAAIKEILDTIK